MAVKQYHEEKIEGLGLVKFRKSKKSRNLFLSLYTDDCLLITLPYWYTYKAAKNDIQKNMEWASRFHNKCLKEKYDNIFLFQNNDGITDKEAKRILVERIHELSYKFGLKFNRVTVRGQRTKWGSCTHNNNISLNIKLARLDQIFMDYVLVHELLHTVIKDHSKTFWTELERLMPGAKKIDRKLRKYKPEYMEGF